MIPVLNFSINILFFTVIFNVFQINLKNNAEFYNFRILIFKKKKKLFPMPFEMLYFLMKKIFIPILRMKSAILYQLQVQVYFLLMPLFQKVCLYDLSFQKQAELTFRLTLETFLLFDFCL